MEVVQDGLFVRPFQAWQQCSVMLAALRQYKPSRGLRRTTLPGGSIAPESLRIIHRPEEIEGRLVPGHWEGDLIKWAFNCSALGTVIARKTRYLILSSSSIKPPIREIDGSAERALAAWFQREPQRFSALRLIPRINRLALEVRQFFPKGLET